MLFLTSLDRDAAVALADRKAEAIRDLVIPSASGDIRPHASFGLFWSDQDYDVDLAFRAADRALYRAKKAGGDRVSDQSRR